MPTASAIALPAVAEQQQHGLSFKRGGKTLQRFDEEIATFPKSFNLEASSLMAENNKTLLATGMPSSERQCPRSSG